MEKPKEETTPTESEKKETPPLAVPQEKEWSYNYAGQELDKPTVDNIVQEWSEEQIRKTSDD